MNLIKTWGLSFVIVAVAVAGLGWGATVVMRWLTPPQIRQPTVSRYVLPQSRAAVQDSCPIPLPEGAGNIQYATWSFGQVTQSWIRFEAPAQACFEHAQRMMEPYANRPGWSVTTTSIAEDTGVMCVLDPSEVDLSWFDLGPSSSGRVFRAIGGRAPVIWVDTNQNAFYCEIKNDRHSLSPP